MPTTTLSALTAPLRAYGAVLFEGYEEPHAEVMALVWGPRFDREHAHTLLERRPGYVPQVLHTVQSAADQFDQLAAEEQRRVRQLILRHRSRWDNAQATQ
ncbi:hypothetical protein [Rhodoferax saidenbachensis]|uniref:Uncharacterized protein n=1 Tax=Rhodoferax saidenbachensis TaxID=1484693 RepID=A0ABU1ZRC9_9BURK|nr:hypothetical protein [Rhodoferax saidenbachensis]MDR7308098.1 hypothetical protein [Rhodoferax saidenbachensis]